MAFEHFYLGQVQLLFHLIANHNCNLGEQEFYHDC